MIPVVGVLLLIIVLLLSLDWSTSTISLLVPFVPSSWYLNLIVYVASELAHVVAALQASTAALYLFSLYSQSFSCNSSAEQIDTSSNAPVSALKYFKVTLASGCSLQSKSRYELFSLHLFS